MPHRTHIIFLTWRLTKTLQKPFLQNFHVVIKIHLPLPLEYEVMVSSIKREITLLLHSQKKVRSKCSPEKQQHRQFRKFCSWHASLCCDSRADEFMTPSCIELLGMYSAEVRWPILRILLDLVHALNTPEWAGLKNDCACVKWSTVVATVVCLLSVISIVWSWNVWRWKVVLAGGSQAIFVC